MHQVGLVAAGQWHAVPLLWAPESSASWRVWIVRFLCPRCCSTGACPRLLSGALLVPCVPAACRRPRLLQPSARPAVSHAVRACCCMHVRTAGLVGVPADAQGCLTLADLGKIPIPVQALRACPPCSLLPAAQEPFAVECLYALDRCLYMYPSWPCLVVHPRAAPPCPPSLPPATRHQQGAPPVRGARVRRLLCGL